MSNEELMKPRYKVIADYPSLGSAANLGKVIDGEMVFDRWAWYKMAEFPKIFRPLQWWEYRKPEDMPQYVRFYMPLPEASRIRKVDKYQETGTGMCIAICGIERFYLGADDVPATEAEYLAQP